MRYSEARELVIITSTATISTMIKAPSEIWVFFKLVLRDFGMPRRWGWAEDLEGGA